MSQPTKSSPTIADGLRCFERRFWVFLGAAVLFWSVAFASGFPPANIDDPFFAGAVVQLAVHDELTNPLIHVWLEENGFRIDRYYVHLPLYFFIAAVWLKGVGVGAAQLSLLHCLAGLITSLAGFVLARWSRLPPLAAWFCLPVWYYLQTWSGYRPDGVGVAFSLVGFVLLVRSQRAHGTVRVVLTGIGSLLLAVGVSMWPISGAVLFPFYGCLLITLPPEQRGPMLVGNVMGGVLLLMLIAWAVRGEVMELAQDFYRHYQMLASGGLIARLDQIRGQWNLHFYSSCLREPGGAFMALVVTASVICGALQLRLPLARQVKVFSIACVIGTILVAIGYPRMLGLFLTLMMLLWSVTFAALAERNGRLRGVFLVLFAVGVGHMLYRDHQAWLQDQAVVEALREVAIPADARIVFDEAAYRDLYDLRPPPGAESWLTWRGRLGGGALSEKRAEDVWVVRGSKVDAGNDDLQIIMPSESEKIP